MIAFSIVESAKKEVTVTRPQQSWLATRLTCINSYKEGAFNKYYHLIFRAVLQGCHDMSVSNGDHFTYLFYKQQDYQTAISDLFLILYRLLCRLHLTSLNLVIYVLNKMLSMCRVLFTVRILRPCFIFKCRKKRIFRSNGLSITLYHTYCFLFKTNVRKQTAHLSSMKGRVPFIEVNLKDLFLSYAQCWWKFKVEVSILP